jgi:TonB family protein
VRSRAGSHARECWPIPVRATAKGVAAVLPESAGETFPVSDSSHHQALTLSVSSRPLFLQPGPDRAASYARIPSVALSVGVHVICLLGGIAIAHSAPERTPRPRSSLTFSPVSLAAPIATLPAPARLAVRRIEPPPKPHALTPADEPSRKIEPPAPTPAVVQAEFLEPQPNAVTVPSVQSAPEPTVRVGAFETVAAARPRTRETAAVMSGGFGSASARGPVRALTTAVVTSGGFDREVAPPPPPPAPSAAPATAFGESSVEILFKPKPRYTDEAEALGIQGTVVLEVEFTASNEVRVLRVVRTLGHGLDEAAVRAAEQIRFKPARRQGVAVDSRVTVQIEFHLS